jgi:hypothetical protein
MIVNDHMQKGYRHSLSAAVGRGFPPDPTPKEMLALNVFGGKYKTDGRHELPDS